MNLLLHAIVLLLKLNGRRSLDAVQAVRIVLHRQKNYVGSKLVALAEWTVFAGM
jgi:hypothetical protein